MKLMRRGEKAHKGIRVRLFVEEVGERKAREWHHVHVACSV